MTTKRTEILFQSQNSFLQRTLSQGIINQHAKRIKMADKRELDFQEKLRHVRYFEYQKMVNV